MIAKETSPIFGNDFPSLVKFLVDDSAVRSVSIARFTAVIQWDLRMLAEKLDVDYNEVTQAMVSKRLQQYMKQSLKVLHATFIINRNVENTIVWFKGAPIPTFGGRTPADLVAEGRTNNLLRYIQSLEGGYSG